MLEGFTPWPQKEADEYKAKGYWPGIMIHEVLDGWAKESPGKEAVVDERRRWTWGELEREVERLAAGLRQLGLREEDRVIVQLPNWAEFWVCFFAISRVGAVSVPVIPQFRKKDIGYLLGLTDAAAMVIPETYHDFDYPQMVTELRSDATGLKQVIVVAKIRHPLNLAKRRILSPGWCRNPRAAQLWPSFREGVFGGGLWVGDRAPEGMLTYAQVAGGEGPLLVSEEKSREARSGPDGVAFISLTGGTTGFPKGVPHTHNEFVGNRRAFVKTADWDASTVTLINKPVELYASLARAFATLVAGGKVVLITSTRPQDTLAAIERERVNTMQIVPTEAVDLLGFPDVGKYDINSLKSVSCGVGAFTADQLDGLRNTLHCDIAKAYGMTEGLNMITQPGDPGDVVQESIGRPFVEGDQVRIVDEADREVPDGAEGELIARGPSIIRGYYRNPEANAEAFTEDGFFRTGDLAVKDRTGNLRITGRKKDWIRRGGQTVVPLEVENCLLSHPRVENVAVIGMPDPRLGERACAYVKPRAGQPISLPELTAFLLEKGLAKYKLPERLELVSELPVVGMGKVDKKALREDIARKLASETGDRAD